MTFPFYPNTSLTPAQVAFNAAARRTQNLQRQVDAAEGNMAFPYASVGQVSADVILANRRAQEQAQAQAQAPRPAPELVEIQEQLSALGYRPIFADEPLGFMSPALKARITIFQQDKRLPVTGIFDTATVAAIRNASPGTLAASPEVAELQQRLQALGIGAVPSSDFGFYTAPTLDLITRFQAARGLPVTATFDSATAAAIRAATSTSSAFSPEVAELQQRLQALGIGAVPPADIGFYTGPTLALITRFQAARGLPVTGTFDSATTTAIRAATSASFATSSTSEFGDAPAPAPGGAAAKYLVPAILAVGVALLVVTAWPYKTRPGSTIAG